MKFTKEELNELSQAEIFFWAEQFGLKEKEDALRKLMLEQIEIEESKEIIQ